MHSKKQKKASRAWSITRSQSKQALMNESRLIRSDAAGRRYNRRRGILGDKFENAARRPRSSNGAQGETPKMIGRKSLLSRLRRSGRGG